MPMSIVPSMFGMNVGGMPLGDSPYGFYWVMGGLAMVVLAQLLVMRKMKLFHRV
jgi:zinc transporter